MYCRRKTAQFCAIMIATMLNLGFSLASTASSVDVVDEYYQFFSVYPLAYYMYTTQNETKNQFPIQEYYSKTLLSSVIIESQNGQVELGSKVNVNRTDSYYCTLSFSKESLNRNVGYFYAPSWFITKRSVANPISQGQLLSETMFNTVYIAIESSEYPCGKKLHSILNRQFNTNNVEIYIVDSNENSVGEQTVTNSPSGLLSVVFVNIELVADRAMVTIEIEEKVYSYTVARSTLRSPEYVYRMLTEDSGSF